MEDKKSTIEYKHGLKMGQILALTCAWCLTGCLVVATVAATVKLLWWLLTL